MQPFELQLVYSILHLCDSESHCASQCGMVRASVKQIQLGTC